MHIVCLSAKTTSSFSYVVATAAAASAFLSRTQLLRGDRQADSRRTDRGNWRAREKETHETKAHPKEKEREERYFEISFIRQRRSASVCLRPIPSHPVPKWPPLLSLPSLYGLIGVKWRSEIELNKNATDDEGQARPTA